MSYDKALRICRTLREVYGNTAVDIQGGEPTIYPEIFDLVKECSSMGLAPSLITNGIRLASKAECGRYRDAGINDFLISVHGLGNAYDEAVGVKGSSKKQLKAIENLNEAGIPFRFNCTLTKTAVADLKGITELALSSGASVVNFIAFNPFSDQMEEGRRSSGNVPSYSMLKPILAEAADRLETGGIEVNVRYLPMCTAERRHLKNFYNFQQLSYDHHEWDFNSWTWTTRMNQKSDSPELDTPIPILLYGIDEYNGISFGKTSVHGTREHYLKDIDLYTHLLKLFSADIPRDVLYRQNARLRGEKHKEYIFPEECAGCSLRRICDGFHCDYASIYGVSEAKAWKLGEDIDDPGHFIKEQEKIIG